MAKHKAEAPAEPASDLVEVRVLVDLAIGGDGYHVNDIALIPPSMVEALTGAVDPHPGAVAYAKSIKPTE